MPTGYTHEIAKGIDFETFVMRCSRAMGALILMRDEPMDAPIPARFEPSDYHTIKIAEANAELEKLRTMNSEEIEVAACEEFIAETKSISEAIVRNQELREKYEAMLARVQAWAPPSPEHEGFKSFMIKQLTDSIEFDCNNNYYQKLQPKQKTGDEWIAAQIARANREIEYHTTEHSKEIERTESRNIWLKSLRDSLGTHNEK